MHRLHEKRSGERGGSLLEFTFVATGFFTMLLAITAASNLYFVHNALVESTRRAARFAATQNAAVPGDPAGTVRDTGGACDTTGASLTGIQNYAIYGNEAGTGTSVLSLQPANICVQYSNFGVGQGSVSVSITNYTYYFVIPFLNRAIVMPAYRSTQAGESAGMTP